MPRNVPAELKLHSVKEYLDGKGSSYLIAEKYGVKRFNKLGRCKNNARR